MARWSKVQICNAALGHIGVSEAIDSIDDDNTEAEVLKLHYDNVLETCLGMADWAFARKRVDLATETGTAPEPWDYQYQYPANCVRPLRIDDELSVRPSELRIPFTTETDDNDARIIFTNQEDATLIYTHLVDVPTLFPPWFSYYFSWELAARIAGPLSSSEKVEEKAEKRALREKLKAIGLDFESEQEDPPPEASWVTARD